MRSLIIFGHRGVGSVSLAAHLAAAYAEAGRSVALIDCAGAQATTLISRTPPADGEVWSGGYKGIACRQWQTDPAGSGRPAALAGLREEIEARSPAVELVLFALADAFDVLDQLLAAELASQIVAVTDAEPVALRTVNALWRRMAGRGIEVGLVGHNLSAFYAEAVVRDFARQTGTLLQGYLPRDLAVLRSSFFGETVIESAPLAHVAYLYRELARLFVEPGTALPPTAMAEDDFNHWAALWGERLYDLGEGYVPPGGGI
ncbi:MAG: hypothetical protein RQ723_02160 [Desulfuromonadales bacterium]|nr:hypothetical protein [Desulfuromonadales bacterium]